MAQRKTAAKAVKAKKRKQADSTPLQSTASFALPGFCLLAAAGAQRLSLALSGRVDQAFFARHSRFLDPEASAEELAEIEEALFAGDADVLPLRETDGASEALSANETLSLARAGRLLRLCAKDVVSRTLMELCALLVMEPEAVEVLDRIAPCGGGVTLLHAARCAGFTGMMDELIAPMRGANERIRFLLGQGLRSGKRAGGSDVLTVSFYDTPYRFDDYLLSFLSCGNDADKAFADFSETFEAEEEPGFLFAAQEEIKNLTLRLSALYDGKAEKKEADARAREENAAITVLLSGERESGRYTAAKQAALGAGLSLLAVDFEYLEKSAEPKELIRRILRGCVLEERALVVRNITQTDNTVFLIRQLQKASLRVCEKPLFLCVEKEVKLTPVLSGTLLQYRVPQGRQVCHALWEGYLNVLRLLTGDAAEPSSGKRKKKAAAGKPAAKTGETAGAYAPEVLAARLSSKMRLTAGQVRRVTLAMYAAYLAEGMIPPEREIYRLCYDVLDDGRYENVKRVEPGFTIDDLKVEPRVRNVLKDICDQAANGQKVYDEWGLRRQYAYGRCISVILSGPPGTGKTMAVHALTSELGLELYKVDLSQITDKYVGESEKRLEEVFTKAEKSNMILFFDEADAVMGKRSEVKEAKDKYANTEISFILQRIEEYDGIVFLATNNLQNIDPAFMRRIRYVIQFDKPEEKTREEIWRSAFGTGVPLAKDVDFPFLAEKFELSGGDIKNIVLNACFLGASEGGEVGMKHIMKAIYRENTKTKRIAFDGDYGGYALLLHD
ncbi:MAG: ATP-binding protein [Lachnospiraceae bacterium]|nr:ATP-binding protein [Lachnospiraceae bacterium]